jgi:hypothetical protein
VVEPRGDVRLVDQRPQLARGVIVHGALDDNQTIEVDLASEQHLTHAARGERPHDLVAIANQLVWGRAMVHGSSYPARKLIRSAEPAIRSTEPLRRITCHYVQCLEERM